MKYTTLTLAEVRLMQKETREKIKVLKRRINNECRHLANLVNRETEIMKGQNE